MTDDEIEHLDMLENLQHIVGCKYFEYIGQPMQNPDVAEMMYHQYTQIKAQYQEAHAMLYEAV